MNTFQTFRQTKLFKVLFILIILYALFSWGNRLPFSFLHSISNTITRPFSVVFSAAGFYTSSFFDFISSIKSLKEENEQLHHDVVVLRAENAKLADMHNQNEALRKELELSPRNVFDLEAADVIGQDVGGWMTISKGDSDGIAKGMPVIIGQGVLIGKVDTVFSNSSRVVLLTHPESFINGVDAKTEAKGIIKGQHGLGLVFDMVLKTDTLKNGDDIVTSGLGGDIPRGLLLGKIQDVRDSDDRLFQQATIVSFVKLSNIQVVSVIKGTK